MADRNVLTWHQAFEMGFEPSDYPFETEMLPLGIFSATLDFKIWATKTIGISCFFTKLEDHKKISADVNRRGSDCQYMLEG